MATSLLATNCCSNNCVNKGELSLLDSTELNMEAENNNRKPYKVGPYHDLVPDQKDFSYCKYRINVLMFKVCWNIFPLFENQQFNKNLVLMILKLCRRVDVFYGSYPVGIYKFTGFCVSSRFTFVLASDLPPRIVLEKIRYSQHQQILSNNTIKYRLFHSHALFHI